jgi:hypothetical protein
LKTLVSFIQKWLETDFDCNQVLYIAIDRTNWGWINLLMISLIWERRAIPIYFELLSKKGVLIMKNKSQSATKFCICLRIIKLSCWGQRILLCKVSILVSSKGVYFCLRLKKNEYIQLSDEIWVQLEALGLTPGISLYLEGVKVTKQKGFERFNLAAKWKKKYQDGHQMKVGLF